MSKPNDSNNALKLKKRLGEKMKAMEKEKLLKQLKDNKEAKAAAVAAAEAAENKEYENVGEAVYNPSIVFDETDDLIPVGEEDEAEDEAEGGSRRRRMRRKTSRKTHRKTRRKTSRKRRKKYTMRGGGGEVGRRL
jgi:hypothetical protein